MRLTIDRMPMKRLMENPFVRYGALIALAAILAAVLYPDFVRGIFSSDGFMPHAHCYMNNPRMIWLHVISDLFIGLAYVSISGTLAYMVWRASRSIPFHWMFLAFGLFIVSCGFTHFMEVWTVWKPVYWLAGYVKVVTAVASVTTAIAMFPLVPKVFAMIEAVKVSEERRLKLMAANRDLEAFASTISHDLRAPLRTMQGMAVALKQDFGDRLGADALHYADRIMGASERMDELIRDLLDYSRVNLSEFELGRVELKDVVEEATSMLAAMIQERNGEIRFEGDGMALLGNRSLLLQVMSNLLSNALKFVAPGTRPEVSVRAVARGENVRVEVRDNGIGIAAQHRERIFKVFERLHTSAEYPGTGIGLAIVQRGLGRLGGEVHVESGVAGGSCFWFELPRA